MHDFHTAAFSTPSLSKSLGGRGEGAWGRGETPFSKRGLHLSPIILPLLLSLFLGACGGKRLTGTRYPGANATDAQVCRDLVTLPQDLRVYADRAGGDRVLLAADEQAAEAARSEDRFFRAWRMTAPSRWVRQSLEKDFNLRPDKAYGENLRPFSPDEWASLTANADKGSFPARVERAITVRYTDLRAMPTNRPFFLNPDRAGEGYPFDYFQHTSLPIGTPTLVCHVSADGQWVLVETAISAGWLPARDVAAADDEFVERWQSLPQAALVRDNVILRPGGGRDQVTGRPGAVRGHVGTLLPLTGMEAPRMKAAEKAETPGKSGPGAHARAGGESLAGGAGGESSASGTGGENFVSGAGGGGGQSAPSGYGIRDASAATGRASLKVLIPVRSADGRAVAETAVLSGEEAVPVPLPLTPANVAAVGNEMMGQPYGWGGLFGNRDCSALTRDIMAPFGIWLPRNSASQGSWGRPLALKGLSNEEKEARIQAEAVPFLSLIWMRGHIGLYLGVYEGKAVMFHNVWGLRVAGEGASGLRCEGRAVIGKAVVTTLRPGAELPAISTPDSLLDRIERVSILPETEDKVPVLKAEKKTKYRAAKASGKKAGTGKSAAVKSSAGQKPAGAKAGKSAGSAPAKKKRG